MKTRSFPKKKRNGFEIISGIIIIGEFIDFITWEASEKVFVISNTIVRLLKTIEICFIPVVICFLASIIYENKKRKKIIKILSVLIVIINTIVMVINYFHPIVFRITDNGGYERMNLVHIYFVVYASCFLILLYQLIKLTYERQNENVMSLVIICLFVVTSIFYIITFSGLQVDWLVISLTLYLIYIYYIDIKLSIDNLTKLLNSRNYRNRIKSINFNTIIIFLDCNKFKFINDHYGHQAGDIALQEYASALLDVYKKYAWVYRRSGDEFTVIFKPGVIKQLLDQSEKKDLNSEIVKLFKQLDENVDERANKIHYLKLGFSYGYAIYISRTNFEFNCSDLSSTSLEYLSIDDAINAADDRTYEMKRNNIDNIENIEKILLGEIEEVKKEIKK